MFLDYITANIPTVTVGAATAAAATQLNGTYNNSPVSIEYYVNATGAALLVYTFEIQNVALGTWYRAFVDAHSARLCLRAELRGTCDCGSSSSSRTHFGVFANVRFSTLAVPVSEQDPASGFATIVDPGRLCRVAARLAK